MNIKQLQKLYNTSGSNIKWAKHCLERMQERDISIDDVESCLQTGEIIENYPDDFPHPSYLIFFITAYFPNTDKFEKDLKTKKRKKDGVIIPIGAREPLLWREEEI